jgi:PKD repeat protein
MKNKNYLLLLLIISLFIFGESCDKDAFDLSLGNSDYQRGRPSFYASESNVPAPTLIWFNNTTILDDRYTFLWDFGDNDTSTLFEPSHTYLKGGVYTVKLTATSSSGIGTATQTITIQKPKTLCKVASIKINEMPLSKPQNVFFKIENIGRFVFFDGTSTRINDVTKEDLPLLWNLSTPYAITPLNTGIYIRIYNYDDLDPAAFIGSVGFNPSTAGSGFPSTVNLTSPGVSVTLDLKWE